MQTDIQTLNEKHNALSPIAYARAAQFANEASGEYFVSKWGWDQTNVTYYAVIKRTAKSVQLVEVATECVPSNPADPQAGGWSAPVDLHQGKSFMRRMDPSGCIRITDYAFATVWDRTPQAYTCGG